MTNLIARNPDGTIKWRNHSTMNIAGYGVTEKMIFLEKDPGRSYEDWAKILYEVFTTFGSEENQENLKFLLTRCDPRNAPIVLYEMLDCQFSFDKDQHFLYESRAMEMIVQYMQAMYAEGSYLHTINDQIL